MRELVVLSGKGGTGKTTVSAALAAYWAQRTVLVDADVEAANLHLVLPPRRNRVTQFLAGRLPRQDPERCTGCGECTEVCRFEAIDAGRVARIQCEGCGLCARTCPSGALRMADRHGGDWFLGQTSCGPLLHARLRAGEGNSGKLVALLKEEARGLAERTGLTRILCDGPPVGAFPAVACLAGAGVVLAVAEPSSSGPPDLRRVLDLAQRFRVPACVTVNRADVAPELSEAVAEECRARDVPVLAHIPFDPAVMECMDRGVPLTARPETPAAAAVARLAVALDDLMEGLERSGGVADATHGRCRGGSHGPGGLWRRESGAAACCIAGA